MRALLWISISGFLALLAGCNDPSKINTEPVNPVPETPVVAEVQENALESKDLEPPKMEQPSAVPQVPSDAQKAIDDAQKMIENRQFDEALKSLLQAQIQFGVSPELETAYQTAIQKHPDLNAEPKHLIIGEDLTGMKRLGGGSSLVYKFTKNKETVAAFKPFQKRYQSNYRSEIAAYRLCPLMKCAFDIPRNIPIYFDYDEFSSMYARNSANPKEEFAEIIPTHLPDGTHRVEGTYKDWIPDYASFPIEFSSIWKPWLNPGVDKASLDAPFSDVLPEIVKKHKAGNKFASKLAPHVQNLTKYELARQISNLIVFDFLINNWDRFSGAPLLYGVNCQIAHGRFMSIDNGAGFPKTPNPKPEKHLREITRFSRLTYDAIAAFDKDNVLHFLFPNPSEFETEKFETFWKQRQKYLDYVKACIEKNGESETFFFE